MKLIIAGSRDLKVTEKFIVQLCRFFGIKRQDISEIVSGGARGIDTCGKDFGDLYRIPVKSFNVNEDDWKKQGKAAGPIRNAKMAEYGDVLLLIWDGKSTGSANMRHQMMWRNKPVHEIILQSYRN